MKAAMTEETPRPGGRPISQIVEDMLSHLAEIVRAELRLVQTEIRQDLRKAGNAGVYLAVAGVCGLLGLGFLLLGAVYGLALVMPLWLAAVSVGLAVSITGLALLGIGLHRMKTINLTPERTIQTLEDNFAWIKKQAS
jgi:hypothetical protein